MKVFNGRQWAKTSTRLSVSDGELPQLHGAFIGPLARSSPSHRFEHSPTSVFHERERQSLEREVLLADRVVTDDAGL